MYAKLLLLTALVAVAMAAPSKGVARAQQYGCQNYQSMYHYGCWNQFSLCTHGVTCIQAAIQVCQYWQQQACSYVQYGWCSIQVCQVSYGVTCAVAGSVQICSYYDEEKVSAIAMEDEGNTDCFCVTNEKGKKVCQPEGCNSGAVAKQADNEDDDDCTCVKNERGETVCDPPGCDRKRNGKTEMSTLADEIERAITMEDEGNTDCFCVTNEKGKKVCQPEGCNPERADTYAAHKQAAEEYDCTCLKNDQGKVICDPPGCGKRF